MKGILGKQHKLVLAPMIDKECPCKGCFAYKTKFFTTCAHLPEHLNCTEGDFIVVLEEVK